MLFELGSERVNADGSPFALAPGFFPERRWGCHHWSGCCKGWQICSRSSSLSSAVGKRPPSLLVPHATGCTSGEAGEGAWRGRQMDLINPSASYLVASTLILITFITALDSKKTNNEHQNYIDKSSRRLMPLRNIKLCRFSFLSLTVCTARLLNGAANY